MIRPVARRFIADGIDQGRRADLTGAPRAARETGVGDARLWLGGQVLGTATFARRFVRTRRREVEAERQRGHVEALPALAAQIVRRFGIARSLLPGRGRARAVSRARRALIQAAVLRRGIRPVDVSRYLRISTAAVARHMRALERDKLDC